MRATIKGKDGLTIFIPTNKVIEATELENYRKSLRKDDRDSVCFNLDELGEEE